MFKRTMEKVIRSVSNNFPVLLVTGPRQVGKTTLLQMCARKNRSYVTLDDVDARTLAINDPQLFIKTFTPPIIIDEVQYAPQLFSAIKLQVDSNKQAPGMYWLTGSQKFDLMKDVNESLAGRVAVLNLLGLSHSEMKGTPDRGHFLPTSRWVTAARKHIKNTPSLKSIYKTIWHGSFPKLAKMSSHQRDIYYSSYIQTYIQRDVRDITGVSNETLFYNFIQSIAAHTGQTLNYANLAKQIGVDSKTIKSWLSILRASGLVFLLQPWHNNIYKRIIKTPKIYFLDTGLASYLTRWNTPDALLSGAMSGAMLETWFISEVVKSYWHNAKPAPIYYYRDLDKYEIDLLIEHNQKLYPVEIKKTATPSNIKTKFDILKKLKAPTAKSSVVCLSDTDCVVSKNIQAIPTWYI